MSATSLKYELDDALQDFVIAAERYEQCLHPATREVLDTERKERRKAVRAITSQLKALPDGYRVIAQALQDLKTWAQIHGHQKVFEIYDPLA
jgi:hypothetical protein